MNSKSLALPLLLTAIFISCLLGVYFYQQSQINSLTSHLISPTPTLTSTSDWKTCSNTNKGFSITYPKDFKVDPTTCNYAVMDYNNVKDISVSNSIDDFRKNWLLTITSEKTSSDVNQWIKNKCLPSCSEAITGPIADSKQYDLLNVHYAETVTVIKTNGIIFSFSLNARNPSTPVNQNIRDVYNQILSTFKFTTPTTSIETTNWQTYTNKEYGLEFKYPQGFELHENYTTPDKKNYYVSVMNPVTTERYAFIDSDLKVEFYISTLDKPLTTEEYFEKTVNESVSASGNMNILKKDVKMIGNQKFGYIQWEGMGDGESYFTVHQNYGFSIAKYPFKTSRQNEFTQILSTLKFTTPATSDLKSQVENWANYIEITDPTQKEEVGAGSCGPNENQEFTQVREKIKTGSYKKLVIGGVRLVITPNYSKWSNEKFLAFNKDETAICGAGGLYPLHAFSDKLLWSGSCGTGVYYQGVEDCEKTRSAIHSLYN